MARYKISEADRADRRARMLKNRQDEAYQARRIEGIRRTMQYRKERDIHFVEKWTAHLRKAEFRRAAKTREANAKRFKDPAEREKARVLMKQRWESGEMHRHMKKGMARYTPEGLAAQRAKDDRRRGFKVPDHRMEEYRTLRRKHQRLLARDIGKMMGLIT